MDFDEYEYLEKSVEGSEIRKEKGRRSSRHHRESEDGGVESRERSRMDVKGLKADREDRDRSDWREKDKDHRRSGDRDRDYRSRDKEDREKDGEKERERESEREKEKSRERDRVREGEKERDREREVDRNKDMERSRRSTSRSKGRDIEYEKEMERARIRERDRVREGEKERDREREVDRNKDMERSRRSTSRSKGHDIEYEKEMERARSREKREREERDLFRDRENRRFRDKKETEAEPDPERDQRTVFAYQMPLKASERDVYEFFSKAGKVRDVRLIMDRISRRSKGVGYIEFYDAMSVPMAIALSGYQLLGQPVMVKPSEAEKNLVQSNTSNGALGAAGVRKIYVGNLHFNMTEDQLRQVFEPFGPVELVQLPLDPETGHCRGYGFIQFSQVEHAKAAQSLNGKLDIAGRIIKVSAVTEHVGVHESGTNPADLDDDDGGGLALNARSRALLMQKLDRTGTASSIAETLGRPGLNGAIPNQQTVPLAINGQARFSAAFPAMLSTPLAEPIGEPSECILLKNMFDPNTETDPDFNLDIKEDVQEECTKFGPLKHIYVDRHSSDGCVYLRFENATAAASCQRAMHMRWFAGRSLSATFMC